jgi:ring-1,2-phenylacetyl-CoA epoxidase subunit PaaB
VSHVHFGSVHAADSETALQAARDLFTRRQEGKSIWVVRSTDVVASDPDDEGELFDPASGKDYRLPTDYRLPSEVDHM